jgi:Zn-dependent peptidase ImmA (M78 family)/DNA-binding XRE family transcriptional regulator
MAGMPISESRSGLSSQTPPRDLYPSRLIAARKRRGLTKKGLAAAIGVSEKSLGFYEKGTTQPSASTALGLAEALGFPIEFFYIDEIDEVPVCAVSFRALSKLTARERDQALASAQIALTLSDWLERRFTLPEPSLPRYDDVRPEVAADALRRDWKLGEAPIRNVVHLLEMHGVRVFSLPPESRDLDAFSFWRGGTPYVFLNTVKSAERSRMDATHELGHLVLHRGAEAPRGKQADQEAQSFGAAFLMPRDSILAEIPIGARLSHILYAKQKWGVSAASLTYRAHTVGLLTDWQYRSAFIELGERGLRRHEEGGTRETSQILAKVLRMLHDDGVRWSDIAEELHLAVSELNHVVFGLTWGNGRVPSDPDVERPDLKVV